MKPGKSRRYAQPNAAAAGSARRRQFDFNDEFFDDLDHWIATDPRLARRLIRLVREIVQNPFGGIGKPEPLRRLPNTWSRRLTDEHRVVYRVTDDAVEFLKARFHYSE